tara:strand:- start:1393 stop:2721 length:1329 start_codon:yes stop_codon:yes gene_type:complete
MSISKKSTTSSKEHILDAKVLVVGGGGREMAQACTIAKSERVKVVYCAPGNAGTTSSPKCSNIPIKDSEIEELVVFAQENSITLVVVGPEAPLVAGISDAMAEVGIPCFGPTKLASRLEASKTYSKEFFTRNNLPTARYKTFTDVASAKTHIDEINYPVVVKASGLAAGKGVLIPTTKEETLAAIDTVMSEKVFGSAGDECVIEECLVGPECSVLAFCDGKTAVCMPGAQDHKRAYEGDEGPNTGGMGAYAPCPCLTPELVPVVEGIIQNTVTALAEEGSPYIGVLFAGFILTKEGPHLLEYNCRMGDPEAQVILPLLKSDLYEIMVACTQGALGDQTVEWSTESAATVVIASKGYPGPYPKGLVISGLDAVAGKDETITVFHAGTKLEGDQVVTSGGRVLSVTGVGSTLKDAVDKAYSGVEEIHFSDDDGYYRKDIAYKAL